MERLTSSTLFFACHGLTCCDQSLNKKPTYINEALNHEGVIDYILASDDTMYVMDLDINFSDHLPITVSCSIDDNCFNNKQTKHNSASSSNDTVTQLRWDYADVVSYYHYTGINLQHVMVDVDNLLANDDVSVDVRLRIDIIYC
jgi:hypothetical protein